MSTTIDVQNNVEKVKAGANKNKAIGLMIGAGILAGMRSTLAPAFLSHYFSRHINPAISNSPLGFIASPVASKVTKALAAMEIAGDKMPSAPDRTSKPQIYIRIASGAFAGAVIARANGQSLLKGILIGGVSALAGSYGALHARKFIDTLPHVKDIYTGFAEDALAIGTGTLLMK